MSSGGWLMFDSAELWPVLVALVGFVPLVIKELSRPISVTRKIINIVCSALAVLALLMIYLRPYVTRMKAEKPVLLLTEGYTRQQQDSLSNIYTFEKEVHYDSLSFTEANHLFQKRQVLIIGNGIPLEDMGIWREPTARYLGDSKKLSGVTKLQYNSTAQAGEELVVRGKLNNGAPGKLILKGFGNIIDTVEVSEEEQVFRLSTPLKGAGRFLFQLVQVNNNGDSLLIGQLPVVVENPSKLNVLMVNSFPTFEQKYLKNFLVSEGHTVVIRNQLTKGKYKFEFYNTKEKDRFHSLDKGLLDDYDLIMIDYNTFSSFNKNTVNDIMASVQEGLGVLVLPDEHLFGSNQVQLLATFNFAPTKQSSAVVSSNDQQISVPTYGFSIRPASMQNEVIKEVSVNQRMGLGKVGLTTLRNTYELVLQGKEGIYKNLWKKQLEALKYEKKKPNIKNNWPIIVNKPFQFKLEGFTMLDGVSINEVTVPMKQDTHVPTHWTSTFWPRSTGWQPTTIKNHSDSLWFYVQSQNSWKSLITQNQVNANKRYFTGNSRKSEMHINKPINRWWFYLLFLFSVAYLWIEPKIL